MVGFIFLYRLTQFCGIAIPYVNEEYAQAATKDPYLKLVLRLISCYVVDPGEHPFVYFLVEI